MGTVILLQLFIGLVILVSIGQLYLLFRYLFWPRIHRITHCPWCWKEAGIANDFPPPWSSAICHYHDQQIRAQASVRRLTRHLLAASTPQPTAVVLQSEEVQV